jgi:hypothetical protein
MLASHMLWGEWQRGVSLNEETLKGDNEIGRRSDLVRLPAAMAIG